MLEHVDESVEDGCLYRFGDWGWRPERFVEREGLVDIARRIKWRIMNR